MTKDNGISLLSKEDQQILGRLDEGSISPKVWLHAAHPRNQGILSNPDGQAEVTGICEDTISFQLQLKENRIDKIRFQARGCGFTVACGSVTTELVRGKSIGEAIGLTGEQILTALGGLPGSHIHCADLTANALKAAARNAIDILQEPWKRTYR